MRTVLLAALALVSGSSLFAQNQQSCPAGTEDMMNYFTMGYPNRLANYMGPGNANPIYTTITPDLGSNFATLGQFLWIKSSLGYPWDVKVFDSNYIYDRSTELYWTDPTSFKRFNIDLPMSRRCVPINGWGGQIKIPATNTNYTSYAGCLPTLTQNLGYVVTSISVPITYNIGNVGSVKTRLFFYQYSCNSKYGNCAYQEVYGLAYRIGLYNWQYYVNQNGTFVLKQESKINQFDSGAATPYLPCTSTYQ